MSELIHNLVNRLGLSDNPNILPKAMQYFETIRKSVTNPKQNFSTLSHPSISIHLACESLSFEFNKWAAIGMSGVGEKAYDEAMHEVRVALGLFKHITLDELNVKFNPPPGIINAACSLLAEFKCNISATMSISASRSVNWGDSVYITAAFCVVYKHMKKRGPSRAKLMAVANTKKTMFDTAVQKLEQFGKVTLSRISAEGFREMAKPPTNKRGVATVEGQHADDIDDDANGVPAIPAAPRGRKPKAAAPPKAAPAVAQMDEVGSIVAQKRGRRAAEPVVAPATASRRTAKSRAAHAQSEPESDAPSTAKRPRRGPAPKSTKSIATKAAEAVNKKAASQAAKVNESRPRIGIVSMINDRDYRETPQYANYLSWKLSMLAAQ
ncbi:Origin of replication complex subunit 6 [Kickxella alabastrina]|nr:Origin of replication complex subunit 6 [Kickxella alabastrina]